MKDKEPRKTIEDFLNEFNKGNSPKYKEKIKKWITEFAAQEVKAALENQGDGWIAVNERLPKESGNCLVFLKNGCQIMAFYVRACLAFHELTTVTHWRELPKAPNL